MMGEMTKDEVNVGLFDECKRLQEQVDVGQLVMKAQRESIEQLKIDCEAYRSEPESKLQEQNDELQAQVKELEAELHNAGIIFHDPESREE